MKGGGEKEYAKGVTGSYSTLRETPDPTRMVELERGWCKGEREKSETEKKSGNISYTK